MAQMSGGRCRKISALRLPSCFGAICRRFGWHGAGSGVQSTLAIQTLAAATVPSSASGFPRRCWAWGRQPSVSRRPRERRGFGGSPASPPAYLPLPRETRAAEDRPRRPRTLAASRCPPMHPPLAARGGLAPGRGTGPAAGMPGNVLFLAIKENLLTGRIMPDILCAKRRSTRGRHGNTEPSIPDAAPGRGPCRRGSGRRRIRIGRQEPPCRAFR